MIKRTTIRSAVAIGITAILLSSCKPVSDEGFGMFEGVKFGPTQKFTGLWILDREESSFMYCPLQLKYGLENCKTYALLERGCWLELDYNKAMKMVGSETHERYGAFVLTFDGRETQQRGEYGHLGQYTCGIVGDRLINIQSVDLFEGPPALK